MSSTDVLETPAAEGAPELKRVLHVGCGFPNPNKLFA